MTGGALIRTVLFKPINTVIGEAVIRTVLFKPINTVIGGAVIRTVLFNWCAACRQWLVKLLSELFYLIGVQLPCSDW